MNYLLYPGLGVRQQKSFLNHLKFKNKCKFKSDYKEFLGHCFNYFNFSEKQIMSKKRNKEFVEVRRIIYYFIYHELKFTVSEIGVLFDKDHSTIVHHIGLFNDMYRFDKEFKKKVNDFKLTL